MSALSALPAECDGILLSEDELKTRIDELGAALTRDYADQDVRLVTVLKGGLFFLADLCRSVELDVQIDFLAVAPYVPGHGGSVRVTKDLDDSIQGATIVLVEDVVDTGLTVNYVLSFLRSHGPARVDVCALFDKPARRIADVDIAYRGFDMPDRFLVGYGLDLAGRYRNLPYVATLRDEVVLG